MPGSVKTGTGVTAGRVCLNSNGQAILCNCCKWCTNSPPPKSFTLTISGVSIVGSCTSCFLTSTGGSQQITGSLPTFNPNGTFTLTRNDALIEPSTVACIWAGPAMGSVSWNFWPFPNTSCSGAGTTLTRSMYWILAANADVFELTLSAPRGTDCPAIFDAAKSETTHFDCTDTSSLISRITGCMTEADYIGIGSTSGLSYTLTANF